MMRIVTGITVLLMAFSSVAIGGEATNCITVSNAVVPDYAKPRQQLRNNCGTKIHVIWCHNGSSKGGTDSSQCGNDGKFWQQNTVLDPGETKANQYSMPPDARLSYGACTGSWGSAYTNGKTDGTFYCK